MDPRRPAPNAGESASMKASQLIGAIGEWLDDRLQVTGLMKLGDDDETNSVRKRKRRRGN
jgi:hypothetical protein